MAALESGAIPDDERSSYAMEKFHAACDQPLYIEAFQRMAWERATPSSRQVPLAGTPSSSPLAMYFYQRQVQAQCTGDVSAAQFAQGSTIGSREDQTRFIRTYCGYGELPPLSPREVDGLVHDDLLRTTVGWLREQGALTRASAYLVLTANGAIRFRPGVDITYAGPTPPYPDLPDLGVGLVPQGVIAGGVALSGDKAWKVDALLESIEEFVSKHKKLATLRKQPFDGISVTIHRDLDTDHSEFDRLVRSVARAPDVRRILFRVTAGEDPGVMGETRLFPILVATCDPPEDDELTRACVRVTPTAEGVLMEDGTGLDDKAFLATLLAGAEQGTTVTLRGPVNAQLIRVAALVRGDADRLGATPVIEPDTGR